MIKETLKKVGMTEKEAEIYIVLAQSGELSVNEIGTKAGLHRPVCYDVLDRLLEKGFVSYILKNNKKHFKAMPPEKIQEYLQDKQESFQSALPELTALFVQEKEGTTVEVLKGKKVLRTIYTDIINVLKKTKKPMLAMGIMERKFLEFDEIAIKQYITKLKENKLHEKLLARESATFFFEGDQSEYRLIPDNLFNPNPTHIYGDNVAIIVWGNPTYGIIMRSKQVADANRKYFELLWQTAKKRKKS